MALVLKDRVLETSSTTGTGTLVLTGTIPTYQSFSAIGNGNTTYYAILGGNDWEVGVGTVGTNTLTRDTVLASSTGSKVAFTAITYVWCDYPASKALYKDVQNNVYANSFNSALNVTTANSATPITLTLASAENQLINTGSGSQTFYLPVATTLTPGEAYYFNNNITSNTVNIYASDTTTLLATIPIGGSLEVICTNTSTTNGTWDIHSFAPANVQWGSFTFNYPGTITGASWAGSKIGNAYLVNSSLTIGSTTVSLGGTSTILAGLTSVTSTSFTGALTGNADTATNASNLGGQLPAYYQPASTAITTSNIASQSVASATNLLGGAANRISYQSALNTTTFVVAPTIASTVLTWNGSNFVWAASPAGSAGGANTQVQYNNSGVLAGSANFTWNGSSIVENLFNVVSQKDVGTSPNQIPLNQYLGTMAFQDANGVTIGGGTFANPVITRQYNIQPTITAIVSAGSTTLTIAQLLTQIIQVTQSAAVTLVLPTGTLTDAGILNGLAVNQTSFFFSIINTGSTSGAITVSAGTGHTIVGSATVAINTSAQFQVTKTATNTFVSYRIA